MKETQRRIKAYKAALPGLRERIAAVAVLLAMSVAMMTSATFAWLTISRAPEVSGVNTTVAANGNLEIALVPKDGSQPAESAVGDSSAAQGQSVVDANVTWGNLVNLSDSSYGLDNLTLRPAQLNRSALLTSPLFGAVYSEDGRIEKLSSSFAYATWQPPEGNVAGYFLVNDEYGIRAISSTTVEAVGFAQQVLEKREAAETANLQAGSDYILITQNRNWMNALASMMGTYMTARLNGSNPSISKEDVINVRDMFAAFILVYEKQIDAMVKLANYQLFLLNNSEAGSTPYTEYTKDTLLATTEATLLKKNIRLTGLDNLKKDYNNLLLRYEDLKTLADAGSITYNDVSPIVNSLLNVGTCTISGKNMATTTVNALSGDKSNAISAVTNGGINGAQITNGVLYNFEHLNGAHCRVEDMDVKATYMITLTLTVDITTTAPSPAQFATCLEYADTLNQGTKGVEVAQDTYGLAIDLWVRTNAPNSYLTLEGNVLANTEVVDATTTDISGNTVNVFTITVTDEEGNSLTEDIYPMEVDAEQVWYYANTHSPVPEEVLQGKTPMQKKEEIVTVIGFEGENRVWEDNSMLSVNSTTQGSGSCYVYYADTPEDQARSLVLLGAMNIAFVDEDGVLMATAAMDTEHFFAENGRVTVPMVLTSESISLGVDDVGHEIRAITQLEQNVAKRITAIVYLDGTLLGNEDVLAASDIQGKLNIQFGSSTQLVHVEDEKLMTSTRTVTAALENTSFVYDQALESGTPMTTTVTIRVDGEMPQNISAFFLRAVSSTQGSREPKISDFVNNGDGSWTGTYTFTAPGNYILRSVDLDGTTYDLAEPQTVTVEGFTVESLSCTQADANGHISVMTASSTSTVDMRLKFASDKAEAMPTIVQGRFLRSDGTAVNINFTYDANSGYWNGQAKFVTSGEYTLQYLVLDGDYTELAETMWQTATVYLGMQVAVYTDSPTNFLYEGSSMADNKQNLYMKVKIMDNTGANLPGLSGATLYYTMQGNSNVAMGMSSPLTWNGSSGYYECTFRSKVGMYHFSTVTVGENTISRDTTSPSFFIQSPEPPSFDEGNTVAYQYVPNNDAILSVLIDNCEAATVWADVKDRNGAIHAVEGYLNNSGSWVFPVPKDAEGRQDGHWTIQQLRLWDVYDEDGNLYTEDMPLIFDLTGEANVAAKVVSQVTARFTENKSQDFTGNAFLVPYTVSGLHVDIYDYEGEALINGTTPLISDVKLILEFVNGSSATYGGYTSDSLSNATEGATITIPLTADSTGRHFTQQTDATILYAGRYTTKLSYRVQGVLVEHSSTDKTPLNNMPMFTVSTVVPSATISAITPTGSNPAKITYTLKNLSWGRGTEPTFTATGNQTSSFDATTNTATLYAIATADNDTQRHGSFTRPTLTLTIAGVDSGCAVTVTLPAGSASAVTFSRTGNGTAKATLGTVSQINSWKSGLFGVYTHTLSAYYGHGSQTITTMTVVKNGMTFTVTLPKPIVINNPSSVNQ